jgi:hypothetical protein
MSRAAYLPFPLFPLRGTVRAFRVIVAGLAYCCLLRLSALECLNSFADCMTYHHGSSGISPLTDPTVQISQVRFETLALQHWPSPARVLGRRTVSTR